MLAVGVLAGNAMAGEAVKIALLQAKNAGFNNCDSAIQEIFKETAQADFVKVKSAWFSDTAEKEFRITVGATYRGLNLTYVQDAVISKAKNDTECRVQNTFVATSSLDCQSYNLKHLSSFNQNTETFGNSFWTKNNSGSSAIFMPVAEGCATMLFGDKTYMADK